MKHIKLYEQFVNEVSKSYNIDKTKFINDVISIWDNADSEDDSEIISNFIKDLEKSDYQVFNKNLKKFKPQELDIIIGPENDPSDVIYVFEDGLVDDMTWNKFYKEYGPEVYGDNSIIVVRKTNKIQ